MKMFILGLILIPAISFADITLSTVIKDRSEIASILSTNNYDLIQPGCFIALNNRPSVRAKVSTGNHIEELSIFSFISSSTLIIDITFADETFERTWCAPKR